MSGKRLCVVCRERPALRFYVLRMCSQCQAVRDNPDKLARRARAAERRRCLREAEAMPNPIPSTEGCGEGDTMYSAGWLEGQRDALAAIKRGGGR